MLEPDNDKLEEFFRKAADRADVTFNEADWKKLEARLDEHDTTTAGAPAKRVKTIGAVVTGLLLVLTALVLLNARYGIIHLRPDKDVSPMHSESRDNQVPAPTEQAAPAPGDAPTTQEVSPTLQPSMERLAADELQRPGSRTSPAEPRPDRSASAVEDNGLDRPQQWTQHDAEPIATTRAAGVGHRDLRPADKKKLYAEMIFITPAGVEKNKQEANVILPGAEEVDTGKAETTVKEEHASEMQHVATPRLSLLLSFAPDFSSTSNQYVAPGKAYGAVIHYHLLRRWSLSAGVIKNNKRYTGAGEDYKPPTGYWKYYTNGIIPASIDGVCDILEFPVMLHYTIADKGKNRWLVSAGASSYLMQSESYQYTFEEPNPGAKEGWASKRSSHFLFNMVNFTIGFEHQLIPGLMAGIEPYVKIPLQEIGWSNVKLFSTGASVTLRYKLIGRNRTSGIVRSRGPDDRE